MVLRSLKVQVFEPQVHFLSAQSSSQLPPNDVVWSWMILNKKGDFNAKSILVEVSEIDLICG